MINIIVGDFGAGKTTMLKTRFISKSKKEKLIYAVMRNDFGKDVPYESDMKKYIDYAVKKANHLFIVDEASTFIPREQPDAAKKDFDKKLITFFVNARKSNNLVFLVFHALEEVPKWLIKYCDTFLRFRTNDMLQYQITRFGSFPNIVKSLKEIPTMQNFEYDEIKLR